MKADFINTWHRVWSNRTAPAPGTLKDGALEQLIAVDGFDSPLGAMGETEWREYVAMFARRAGIEKDDTISEVGCGSGAFLFPFYEAGHDVSGIDYSEELIRIAQTVMPRRREFLRSLEAVRCQSSRRTA